MASETCTGRPSGNRRPGSQRTGSLGTGLLVLLGLALAGLIAAWHLRLDPRALLPDQGGLRLLHEFFSAALHPAVRFEGPLSDAHALGVPGQAFEAIGMTIVFAAAAISLAVVGGFGLGLLSSTAWWDVPGRRRRAGPIITATVRTLTTLMRSIHELIWAVLFLAALGTGHLVAVVAIAIPYAGTLAKIFSELIDEAPRPAHAALDGAGATPWQAMLFGLVPRALPDMAGYVFYRFECALRSSAVLGFFGFPTLGYYLSASFENLYYHEVWTYLYALFALVLAVDLWSGRLRRELVR